MDDLSVFSGFSDNLQMLGRRRNAKTFKKRFDPLTELTEDEFRYKYRFSKANLIKVVDLVRDQLEGDYRGGKIKPELQVAAAVRSWARNEIQDDCADVHGFSQPTLSVIRKRVAEAIASHSGRYINMPSTPQEQDAAIADFARIAGFPQVIGAVDGTHIRISKVGGNIGQFYINRKNFYSINVQVVCDANLKIRDIVASYRGSAHDSRIFRESRLKERFEAGEFHGRLLGDSGYGCCRYLFTPVLRPRNQHEENYNKAHITTRNPVERLFGVWKQRFQCLLRGMTGSLDTIKTTIVALAVLHNMAIEFKEDISGDFVIAVAERDENEPDEIHGNRNILGDITRQDFIRNFY